MECNANGSFCNCQKRFPRPKYLIIPRNFSIYLDWSGQAIVEHIFYGLVSQRSWLQVVVMNKGIHDSLAFQICFYGDKVLEASFLKEKRGEGGKIWSPAILVSLNESLYTSGYPPSWSIKIAVQVSAETETCSIMLSLDRIARNMTPVGEEIGLGSAGYESLWWIISLQGDQNTGLSQWVNHLNYPPKNLFNLISSEH